MVYFKTKFLQTRRIIEKRHIGDRGRGGLPTNINMKNVVTNGQDKDRRNAISTLKKYPF